jgi:hypothetical protein
MYFFNSIPGTLSLGVKWPECEADHCPPSSSNVMNSSRLHGLVTRFRDSSVFVARRPGFD